MADPGILDEAVTAAATGTGVGGGFFALRWLVLWLTGRLDKRQALLDAQDERVDREWQTIREELKAKNAALDQRLDQIEQQNNALRFAFQHVAGALVRIDPKNEALIIADRILAAAFPADFSLGVAMAGAALDEDDRRRTEQ